MAQTGGSSFNNELILEKQEKLHHIRDLNTLLDSILYETRNLTDADAGSIFLAEGNKLRFSYVQNDSLFNSDFLSNKYIYTNNTIDINESSIAGYVAANGKPLLIDNAYAIPSSMPFSFNGYFDEISSYKTVSMLIVPIKTSKNDLVGVLQLINRLDNAKRPIPFSDDQKYYISQFAFYAGIASERAVLLRDIVYKMVRTTELRDPEESPAARQSSRFFLRWKYTKNGPNDTVFPAMKSITIKISLKISAMLHDIGKVGVTDSILRKPAALTPEEFASIKLHTVYGAQFFENPSSEWDTLAYEIALNHHEKWDGTGYPGTIENIHAKEIVFGPGKKGLLIPLSARIVALADVYDALSGRRTYKDPWEEDRVLYHLRSQSGKHFDPEIVDIFFEILDVMRAIRNKWS